MKGIIIAGGLGTRLRPLTYQRPKPLTPVANRPFLEYQVALLREHGVDDIVFATNYMAERIEAHFGDGTAFGVRMRYALEDTPLGTGGAIRNAAEIFPDETVCVFNGDVLTDFNLEKIIEFHMQKKAIATITLAEVPSPNPYGVLILDKQGKVQDWTEPSEEKKKTLSTDNELMSGGKELINAGFYVLEPSFIAQIPHGVSKSLERDIFPSLIHEKAPIFGTSPKGYWMDVGRAEQLLAATQAILSGQIHTAAPGQAVGAGTTIAPSTWINGMTSIGKKCRIGDGCRLENCIVMDGCSIGKHVRLSNVIVDEGCRIQDEVIVEGRSSGTPVIASGSTLARGTRLVI